MSQQIIPVIKSPSFLEQIFDLDWKTMAKSVPDILIKELIGAHFCYQVRVVASLIIEQMIKSCKNVIIFIFLAVLNFSIWSFSVLRTTQFFRKKYLFDFSPNLTIGFVVQQSFINQLIQFFLCLWLYFLVCRELVNGLMKLHTVTSKSLHKVFLRYFKQRFFINVLVFLKRV